ncbi:helix-turn-helix transcriptional regulator, partial [bacterium]|nr:helix-turn-helix transcriptional regulator [bacterium]
EKCRKQEKLFISYHTVKNHVYKIFQKMGVSNRYELMHLASHQDEA